MESSKLKAAADARASRIPLALARPLCLAGQPINPTATAVRPAAIQVEVDRASWEKPRMTKKKATRMDLIPIRGETIEASPARRARKSRAWARRKIDPSPAPVIHSVRVGHPGDRKKWGIKQTDKIRLERITVLTCPHPSFESFFSRNGPTCVDQPGK